MSNDNTLGSGTGSNNSGMTQAPSLSKALIEQLATEQGFSVDNEGRISVNCDYQPYWHITDELTAICNAYMAEMIKSAEPVATYRVQVVRDDGSHNGKPHYKDTKEALELDLHCLNDDRYKTIVTPLYTIPPNASAQIAELQAKLDEAEKELKRIN